jgi:CTP:molybdopterin cytidylyltransferase MocA
MIVDPSGGQAGTLGGGCVEAEVKQQAIRRIGQAGAELHTFLLDHDYAWADGLICGGKMVIVTEGALVVVAERVSPDMRASVELGLGRLGAVGSPRTVLLVPGDCTGITPDLVARVVHGSRGNPDRIIVPVVTGTRGHPVALPWRLASEIPHLPPGIGVNALVKSRAADVVELEVDDLGAVADLDTPEDYQRWAVSPPKLRPCPLRWSGAVDREDVYDAQGHDQNQVPLPRDVQENDGQRDREAHPVGQE